MESLRTHHGREVIWDFFLASYRTKSRVPDRSKPHVFANNALCNALTGLTNSNSV
ncbi:hypothetical protein LvStA_00114 [Burkholderia gladioli]|nr:hypothetical protein LvStA_00114 [Burkholderia gladioli]